MAELELRHLRVVLAIAETGSQTKAAAKLGVSQPALTAQLARIERMLGGRLFIRSPHGAEPTPLGKFIVGRAGTLVADMDDLVGAARQHLAGVPKRPSLRVGTTPLLMFGGFVRELQRKGAYDEVSTHVEPATHDVLGMLAAGLVDVAVCERFDDESAQDVAGIRLRTLVFEPMLVAISEGHPLAARDAIDLADLAGCDWVVPPAHDNPYRRKLRLACQAAGFTPRVRHLTNDPSTASMLVSHGAVSVAAAASKSGNGLVVRPLTGEPLITEILFATRTGDPPAEVADELFRAAAAGYLATLDRNPPYLRRWYTEHPDSHAAIDLALGPQTHAGPP